MPYFLDCYINYYYQHKSCCRNQFALLSANQTNKNYSLEKISLKLPMRAKQVLPPPPFFGFHKITWNGTDNNEKRVATGVYFYRFDVNNKTEGVKKCLMLK
ncbi:MAG: hypothetical protein PHR06_08135 [Candidatus Cloacimonetes bacterium]|nr:hypothetical protein [Candidatus Cloacimonadota bacterium]